MGTGIAQSEASWSSEASSRKRARRRDALAPLGAAVVLMFAHFLFGAAQPLAAMSFSAALIAAALAALVIAGPRHVTLGMVVVVLAVWSFAFTGLAGNLDQAAPELAAILGAGAAWTIGYVCGRQRGALDAMWTSLIWTSLAYCVWFFFSHVASQASADAAAPGFASPASAPLLFALFAMVGCARVLHVIKRVDADASAGREILDRLMREGLGGILLIGFATICLFAEGTQVGVLLAGGCLLGYVWWDTLGVVDSARRGGITRLISRLTPLAAIGLAAWGVTLAWMQLAGDPAGAAAAHTSAPVGRAAAYFNAFVQRPATGYGLGSVGMVGDRMTTLANAQAMLAPGGAHNVFLHWLVEAGVAGTGLLLLVIGAIHIRIARGFGTRRIPRTFLRLAFAASALMLLHGVTDSSLDLPSAVWLYAMLLGAGCGVASLARKPKTNIQPV